MLIGLGALCGLGGVEAVVWGSAPLSEGSFMSPCNHQVLNSTIRSCYFVAILWHEAGTVSWGRWWSGEGHGGNVRLQQEGKTLQTNIHTFREGCGDK